MQKPFLILLLLRLPRFSAGTLLLPTLFVSSLVTFALVASTLFFSMNALAAEDDVDQSDQIRLQVLTNQVPVFGEPDAMGAVRMRLKKGRKLVAKVETERGFYQLVTKSGQMLFVRTSDVKVLGPKTAEEEDLLSGDDSGGARARTNRGEDGEGSAEKWRATFDLGISAGSVGKTNYTEGNLGLNLYFTKFLALRNALWGRFSSGLDTTYGLDTSLRGILNMDLGPVGGITTFAGPGYRFANQGFNVPFAEAGLVLKLVGFAIGGGAKVLMNGWKTKGAENDTQYFIILSGGGSL